MAIVGNYLAIRDLSFTISTAGNSDEVFNFHLGGAASLNHRMILQFLYVSSQDANNLSFRFEINGNTIRTINVTGNSFGTIHEIPNGSNLVHGQNNIKAEIIGGSGSVTLSDLLLFFQHDA